MDFLLTQLMPASVEGDGAPSRTARLASGPCRRFTGRGSCYSSWALRSAPRHALSPAASKVATWPELRQSALWCFDGIFAGEQWARP